MLKSIVMVFFTLSFVTNTSFATFNNGEQIYVDGLDKHEKICGSYGLPKALKNLVNKKTSGARAKTVKFGSIDEVYNFLSGREWTGSFYSNIFKSKSNASESITYSFLNSFSEMKKNKFGIDTQIERDLSKVKTRRRCRGTRAQSDLNKTAALESRYGVLPLSHFSIFNMDNASVSTGELSTNVINENLSVRNYYSRFLHMNVTSYTFPDGRVVDQLYFERILKLISGRQYPVKYYLFSER